MLETNSSEIWFDEAVKNIFTKSVHDLDFLAFGEYSYFAENIKLILDIGANKGQSLCSFNSVLPGKEIYCFEANPIFFPVLTRLSDLLANVTIHRAGLGRLNDKLPFYIPFVGEVEYLEESSLQKNYFEKPWVKEKFLRRGGLNIREIIVQIKVADDLNICPQLIKIDVEGSEFDVLLGLSKTIDKCKPSFLIENSDYVNVTDFLGKKGYLPYQYDTDISTFTSDIKERVNTFYFHKDLVQEILNSKKF